MDIKPITADGLAAACMAALTLLVLLSTLRHSRRSHINETLSDFNNRYDRLWEFRYGNPEPDRLTAEAFYARFWSLQRDQYLARQNGFVPDSRFRGWLYARHIDHQKNEGYGTITFEEGVEIGKRRITDADFWSLMERNFRHSAERPIPLPRKRFFIA